jgi:hypothetical protein
MHTARLLLALLALFASPASLEARTYRDEDPEPVSDPGKDLEQASVKRTADDRLLFELRYRGEPDIEDLRIFLDVDGPERGEPQTGADFLLEGPRFYR